MPFFQVQLLRQLNPEGDLPWFHAVVQGVKPAGKGVKNASYILEVDETPIEGCNEIPVNAANSSKVLQYLLRNHSGKVDPQNLVGCAILFGYKEYPDYQDPITGLPQVGLSIKEIEPFDTDTMETMVFDQAAEELPEWAQPEPPEPTKAELKRQQLKERLAKNGGAAARQSQAAKPAVKTAAAKKAAPKKRK